jgi:hypothetical protein
MVKAYIFSIIAGLVACSSLKCEDFIDCFNCTMAATCKWNGNNTCTTAVLPKHYAFYGSVMDDGEYTINVFWEGDNEIRENVYPFGAGNTYSIFKSAPQCGDPLNICTKTNVTNLYSEG